MRIVSRWRALSQLDVSEVHYLSEEDMVGVLAKSARGRATSLRSKYFLEDRAGMKRISPAAALQSEGHFDSFPPADAMEEPFEFDQPVQCPSPESSITEDGILWRAKMLGNLRRRNEIWRASIEHESVSRGVFVPNKRTLRHFLSVPDSAPEDEHRKSLE